MNTGNRTVPQDLRDRILAVVDSTDMRNYLAEQGNFDINHWIDLIVNAPRPMDLKLELLRELRSVDMDREDLDRLNQIIQLGETAINKLYHMDQEKSVVLMGLCDPSSPDPYLMGKKEPWRTYEHVLEEVRYEYLHEEDQIQLEDADILRMDYVSLELCDVINGRYQEYATYYCAPNGKVYYLRINNTSNPSPGDNDKRNHIADVFSGNMALEDWKIPFRAGDILYVDMRPFYRPIYCLIYQDDQNSGSGDREIRCLYPTFGGLIGSASFRQGGFLPHLVDNPSCERPFFSPFYRAERYTGEMPGKYEFMRPLSLRLRTEPELSERINHYYTEDGERNCAHLTYVYRPISPEDLTDTDDDCDFDFEDIWIPDRKGIEYWWEDRGGANGFTSEQLFKVAGIESSEGSACHDI